MTTLTKSRFARRSLVLCGVAGAVVIWLMLGLVNIQLVSPRKTGGLPSGGILEREVLRPPRGRIMDANEEILTNNMHSSILVADGYHLSDPKVISYALAYSKAVHSPLWAEAKTEKDQEKLVSRLPAKKTAARSTTWQKSSFRNRRKGRKERTRLKKGWKNFMTQPRCRNTFRPIWNTPPG